MNTFPKHPKPLPAVKPAGHRRSPWAGGANWTVGLMAAVLLMTSVGGYIYHREQLSAIAAEHMRLRVAGPAALQTGASTQYTITTTSIAGDAVPAQIEFALYSPDGKRLLGHKETVDGNGRLQVIIPDDMALPSRARLKIAAVYNNHREEVDTLVNVEPGRYVTQLSLDKPLYKPGETIYYRSLTLSRFHLAADRRTPIHFEILDPAGAVAPDSQIEGITDRGVGSGQFKIPDEPAVGKYTLLARSLDNTFPEQRRAFFIRKNSTVGSDSVGGDSVGDGIANQLQSPTESPPIMTESPPTVEVTFYPEGGELVAWLENRVYFVARDPLGKPMHLKGVVVTDDGEEVALLETTHEGMGSFSFISDADREYYLKVISPDDVTDKPELPDVSTEQKIVLNTGSGVFEATGPLEFNVRAVEPGIPLVVAAHCRGIPIGRQMLVTKVDNQRGNGSNPVAIDLPDDAGGVIRLTVYDYSTSPPKLLAERLVYRRMGQKLNVRPANLDEQYSPGDKVELSLLVTDENGEPAAAALSVAVVDNALLNLADGDSPDITTYFLLGAEVENPEDIGDADFYMSDNADAAVAIDLLLGTHVLSGTVSPPTIFDNLGALQEKYDTSLSNYLADRTKTLSTLTTVSFFAGLGLVLLVAMLGLLKVVEGIHLWVPAVGVTVCCLVIGAILMDPSRLGSGPNGNVAFQPFGITSAEPKVSQPQVKPPDEKDETVDSKKRQFTFGQYIHRHVAGREGDRSDLAETLYWNPLLIADADGKATVAFELPDSITTFRVSVDAHGEQRIGSGTGRFVSRIPLKVETAR